MINRCVRRLGAVFLLAIAGCHHADLPPIDGAFVFSDGQEAVFRSGVFVGTAFGRGTYIVEGTHVTVRMESGARLEGERLDDAHLQLTRKDGQSVPAIDLYRAGSPGAMEGKRTLAARLGHPLPTEAQRDAQAAAIQAAIAASAFTPDPSVPLERYTPLDTAEDAALVEAAFAAPPLSDEQLAAQLIPGYTNEPDTFKRHDLASVALPALRTRIEQTRSQHYYSVPVSIDAHERGVFASEALGPYELATHSFPLVSGPNMCFRQLANGIFRADVPRLTCRFPVDDEAVARKLEAARASNIFLQVGGRAYFAVTGAAPFHSGVPVVAIHAQLRVVDPHDSSVHADASL